MVCWTSSVFLMVTSPTWGAQANSKNEENFNLILICRLLIKSPYMYNRVQRRKNKKCLTDIHFHPELKVTAFTRPVRTMKYLGQTREATEEWQQMVTGLCGPLWFWAGSRIRHNSCHAQISDIFSSSVACVTLATPLRQQMGRQNLGMCSSKHKSRPSRFFRALGFSHVRRRHKNRRWSLQGFSSGFSFDTFGEFLSLHFTVITDHHPWRFLKCSRVSLYLLQLGDSILNLVRLLTPTMFPA